jgi:TrmH family RNA methyltransferase
MFRNIKKINMLTKATIKDIQSLQHKKFRNEFNAFSAEGTKLVEELLSSGAYRCQRLFALQSWSGWNMANRFISNQTETHVVEPFEMERISSLSSPGQVLAVFSMREAVVDFEVKGRITLALDDIQDPGNMGTIIRTADWFGIQNIVCSLNSVDCYNPKVVQSTMASLARVNVVYTDLSAWLDNNHSVPILAASMEGEIINKSKFSDEGILIIGNEGKGISSEILEKSDRKITIPRIGSAESLNAAVATSILLYQLKTKS